MTPGKVRGLAAVGLIVCLILTLYGLALGFHIEETTRAIADAQKGQQVGYPAALGLLMAVFALIGSNRRWAILPLFLSLLLAAVSVVLAVTT